MKLLFDTNFYVTEGLFGAQPRRILFAALAARCRVFVTSYIVQEVERVLLDKFDARRSHVAKLRRAILSRSTLVPTPQSKHVVEDDLEDTPILRAAVGAGVDYLITNDRHLLKLHPYHGLSIVSFNEFERIMQDLGWTSRP